MRVGAGAAWSVRECMAKCGVAVRPDATALAYHACDASATHSRDGRRLLATPTMEEQAPDEGSAAAAAAGARKLFAKMWGGVGGGSIKEAPAPPGR